MSTSHANEDVCTNCGLVVSESNLVTDQVFGGSSSGDKETGVFEAVYITGS